MDNLKEVMSFMKITENLNVSEACLNDIINIVEEIINELRDNTVDASTEKRLENRARAFYKYMENPSDENWKEYKTAEVKSNKNSDLSLSRDSRHGVFNTTKAGRIPKEMVDKNPEKYTGTDSAHVKMFQKAMDKVENERK